ncbi:DMT family transporter [Methylobacterium sp. WL120]|uniref:DMT family transporter n=1 Tax=Methylobacterium sp. WL120 TaxID=2603887 RepID=UPI0011C7A81A|nr:DMT family transporter [Methylobacterium sp. WL120]TXM58431.1 EamA family transporter [Methylobacterium sp. WL120]
MTPAVVALVLFAALLHAGWNTLLRGGTDRLWTMSVMNLAVGGLGLAVALAVGLPAAASWPYAVASGLIHIAYNALLIVTYRTGDLGQTYPIARGASPALVALGAGVFASEVPGTVGAVGIALVSGGILSLSLGKAGLSRGTVLAALGTAATIAAYTLIDGIGVRLSGDWVAYTAAMFTFHLAFPLWLLLTRGPAALGGTPAALTRAVGGGAASLMAYAAVIWAMRLGAMGPVSALRETSVVFAALLGRFVLKERLTAGRIAACLVIAAGAAMIGHG